MALTKNAILRYQVLDRCFRNPGKEYTLEDLLEECNKALYDLEGMEGIKRRQLQKDIRFMESEQGWSIPLERHRFGKYNQKVFYRYSDMSFSINNQPLNETEAHQLKSALQVLSRFTGSEQFDWVGEIIPVIENKLGLVGKGEKVIEFDTSIYVKGKDYIKPFFDAIVNRTVLNITYKPFKSGTSLSFAFHPYYIKQYNNRWFVFGLNEEHGKSDWNIPFDRIESFEATDKAYQTDDTDWNDYFEDIVGVTKPENAAIEEVKLRFNKEQTPYVITKPLHSSQRPPRELDDGSSEIRIKVMLNFELERMLLSFGERVEVLAPLSLREKIAQIHQEAAGLYS